MMLYRLSYWDGRKQGWVEYHKTTCEADMYAGLAVLLGLGYTHVEVCQSWRDPQTLEPQLGLEMQCQNERSKSKSSQPS